MNAQVAHKETLHVPQPKPAAEEVPNVVATAVQSTLPAQPPVIPTATIVATKIADMFDRNLADATKGEQTLATEFVSMLLTTAEGDMTAALRLKNKDEKAAGKEAPFVEIELSRKHSLSTGKTRLSAMRKIRDGFYNGAEYPEGASWTKILEIAKDANDKASSERAAKAASEHAKDTLGSYLLAVGVGTLDAQGKPVVVPDETALAALAQGRAALEAEQINANAIAFRASAFNTIKRAWKDEDKGPRYCELMAIAIAAFTKDPVGAAEQDPEVLYGEKEQA